MLLSLYLATQFN